MSNSKTRTMNTKKVYTKKQFTPPVSVNFTAAIDLDAGGRLLADLLYNFGATDEEIQQCVSVWGNIMNQLTPKLGKDGILKTESGALISNMTRTFIMAGGLADELGVPAKWRPFLSQVSLHLYATFTQHYMTVESQEAARLGVVGLTYSLERAVN